MAAPILGRNSMITRMHAAVLKFRSIPDPNVDGPTIRASRGIADLRHDNSRGGSNLRSSDLKARGESFCCSPPRGAQ